MQGSPGRTFCKADRGFRAAEQPMRRLAAFTASFSAGIFLAQYLLPGRWQLPLAAGCFVLMGLAWAARPCLSVRWKAGHAWLRIVLICAGAGLALTYNPANTSWVQAPAERLAGTERQAVMTLVDYPVKTRYGAKAAVRLDIPGLRGKALYYGEDSLLDLRPGNTLSGETAFRSASRIQEDDVTAFTSRGIFLLASGRGEMTAGEGTARSPRWWPVRLGRALREKIQTIFDSDTAPFLIAILTGDKSGLPAEDSTAMSEAGLLHILAVSGMHCAFLLGLIEFFTGRQNRRLTAAAAIPLLGFYMLLTGCSPSVVRACVMLIFLLSAPLFRRESDALTALSAALFLILLQNPFAAKSVSLQLSFAAVSGILWLTPRLSRWLLNGRKPGRAVRFLTVSFSTTMGALVFTVPLSAVYFNILVLLAPVSNLLCLPAASLIFALGLASALTAFVCPPLAAALGLVPALLVRYVLLAARLLSRIPYHAVYFSNPYLKYWLVFAYFLFGLAWRLRGPRRKYATASVLAAVTLLTVVRMGEARDTAGRLNAAVLDVGQGACTVLSSGGRFALVDCGSGNSWYDAGELAADTLQSQGCFRLDTLILTHYDWDHISGVEKLLARLRVARLLAPDTEDDSGLRETVLTAAERCGAEIELVRTEETLELGEAVLTVYPPVGESGDNQRGLACLASAGDYDLLITGDMDSATERRLLEQYDLPDIEALEVGHHGSKSSTSWELLEALKPETAIISVGANSYGHPARQTLRRLQVMDAEIYRTDLQGTIHITVN